jgi:uncharacterized membrane protein YciS (DUF1049 family)
MDWISFMAGAVFGAGVAATLMATMYRRDRQELADLERRVDRLQAIADCDRATIG